MAGPALRVAIQMDPIESIDIAGDTSFRLGLEAQARGHSLFIYQPDNLSWQQGKITARGHDVRLYDRPGEHVTKEPAREADLSRMDVILMRQDPPFDMSYITATHLLEQLAGKVLVVNDPVSVRNAPEKLLVTQFADLMPPTLISRDPDRIKAFWSDHGDIIIKPLFGNGGAGVFRLRAGDENIHSLMEMFFAQSREPVMVQSYLPAVRQGDKRIILIEGEAAGAINRVPAKGEARSNMHVGGRAEACEMSARDLEICAAIGPLLREQGLIFVGIDVIGDWLTEINVTSPTGIREIERFSGVNLAARSWEAIEARRAGRPPS